MKSNNEVSEQESSSKIRIIITSILTDRVLLVKYQYFGSRQINTSSRKKPEKSGSSPGSESELPVEGSQKLDGIKTLFFVTAVKEKFKKREVVYVFLYYKPAPRLQTKNYFLVICFILVLFLLN